MDQEGRRKSIGREYYESLLIAFIFVNFARIFVFQAFKIPSGSMYDNLLVGDHIIVNKYVYGPQNGRFPLLPASDIKRGDVVIFRYPEDREVDFIKRVIALPGETVEIADKQVRINGKPLAEPYKIHADESVYPLREPPLPEPWRSRDQLMPTTVPPGHYFVLGDNRDRSHDSRYWGTVSRNLIKGRALLVYWSFRGTPASGSAPAERLRELFRVTARFLPDTRWDRTLMVIGHRYHYDEPETSLEY
jgi:signal peptidase I